MSMPNIPTIDPTITVTCEQAKYLLYCAVALEAMGLSHIINAEAEKIQYVLGTLEGIEPAGRPTFAQLMQLNDSVASMLKNVTNNQMQLQSTLDYAKGIDC